MSDASALWGRAYAVFEAQIVPQPPQVNLNRIAAKCIGLSFDPSNCDILEEVLSPDNYDS
jgi:hypothetical protein